jgi:shikimate dehydrogenase
MKKYGLLGYPLKHSFSQRFFTEKFAKESIDAQYLNFEIPSIEELPAIIENNEDLMGFNVTIPYKEKVMAYLSELDKQAAEIGAVNVVKILREGGNTKLIGYNTDILGFQKPMELLINKELHKKALVLGTGGASKAICHGLINLEIEPKYVSRTPRVDGFTYNDLNEEIISEYKVIVNTTPLGTFPDVDEAPDIPYQFLTAGHLLYDLVYNPAETKFLRLGKERGAAIKNGADMLEIQALASWEIWNRE